MKVVLVISVLVCAYYVLAERCQQASMDCRATRCSDNKTAHVECQNGDCTCVLNPNPCIDTMDCGNGTCIDKHGFSAKLHCVDSYCRCVDI